MHGTFLNLDSLKQQLNFCSFDESFCLLPSDIGDGPCLCLIELCCGTFWSPIVWHSCIPLSQWWICCFCLYIASMIGDNISNLSHLIHVLSNATGVVGWLATIGASDGMSVKLMKLQHFWFPWAGLQKLIQVNEIPLRTFYSCIWIFCVWFIICLFI